jgi:hypothetical protein
MRQEGPPSCYNKRSARLAEKGLEDDQRLQLKALITMKLGNYGFCV